MPARSAGTGGVPRRLWCGPVAAGLWRWARFSRNAQRPCEGLPEAASRRSGWVAVASAGAADGFSRNAQRPCQGPPGAASRRSRWVAVASAGRRAGFREMRNDPAGVRQGLCLGGPDGSRWHRRGLRALFSRNAQRPRKSPRGAASRRPGWVAVASAGRQAYFRETRNDPPRACQGLRPGGRDGSRRHRREPRARFREMRNDPARVRQGLHPDGRDGSWWHRREPRAGFRKMRNDPARVSQGLHTDGRDGSRWHRR